MTREEAISFLQSRIDLIDKYYPQVRDYREALDVAIKALEQQKEQESYVTTGTLSDDELKHLEEQLKKAKLQFIPMEQEPCGDAISREDTLKAMIERVGVSNECYLYPAEATLYTVVKNMPPVTPQSKTSQWINKIKVKKVYDIAGEKTWGMRCQCEKCGFITIVIEDFGYYDYCPNCGAKMAEIDDVSDTNVGK